MLKSKTIDYTEVVELAKQVEPEMAEKDDLFDEVIEVNRMLCQISDEVFKADPAESKWQNVFKVSQDVDLFVICLTYFLGQRLSSKSLPSRRHHSFHPVVQCVRRASFLLVQGSVDRCEEFTACENGQSSSASAGQFPHQLC